MKTIHISIILFSIVLFVFTSCGANASKQESDSHENATEHIDSITSATQQESYQVDSVQPESAPAEHTHSHDGHDHDHDGHKH